MRKQKLSKEGAKAKAVRDVKISSTPERRAKNAESKRKRREAEKKNGKLYLLGKDYDHKDSKFKSVKANRGNDGKGTKKEGNKKTKK